MSETRVEFGRMIDCDKNGCDEPHSDDGEVVPWEPGWIVTVNSHACTLVRRTITYSSWRPTTVEAATAAVLAAAPPSPPEETA